MIDYTGHPLIDVGLATLVAFANKTHPTQLDYADLDKAADYMAENYIVDPLKSFLTVAFPNSGYTNPAYEKIPASRKRYARQVLRAFRAGTGTLEATDPFTGLPAADVSYDVKDELERGRGFRQHVPLLTGEGYINYHPSGRAGLPLSGLGILAMQALPLGCAKVQGRLLAVHSDDPELLLHFAGKFLQENRQKIMAARLAGEKKLAENKRGARTLLIETLLEAERQRQVGPARDAYTLPLISLTAYHFTNSGQGADLAIYPLPLEVGEFLRTLLSPLYQAAWESLVQAGWQISKAAKAGPQPEPYFNVLFEDLFNLPDEAGLFIRRYFLRVPARGRQPGDPSASYSTTREAGLVSWPVTALFLRKVMRMDKNRIEQIRKMGEALAAYVHKENDIRFFQVFLTARRYDELRAAIIKASHAQVKRGQPPLVNLDGYIAVFEEGLDLPRADWRLGRDLALIGMMDCLHQNGWLRQHQNDLPDPSLDSGE